MAHPRTYSTLINCCIKAPDLHQGLKILDEVESNHSELLKHSRLIEAAVRLLVICGDIDKAVKFIDVMSETDSIMVQI